jgi:predicted Ser/Thr protein kinase
MIKLDDFVVVDAELGKKGKDGNLFIVHRGNRSMIAKVFKNKNIEKIEAETFFLKKGYELGISPKTYGYGNNYILMDRLEYSLFDVIKKNGKMTKKHQTDVIKILEILDKNKIFHGDVSPLNFMFDKNGKMYIIDYGMSKNIDSKFLKKYGNNSNIKLGLTVFILNIRKVIPDFEPTVLTRKIFQYLDLKP